MNKSFFILLIFSITSKASLYSQTNLIFNGDFELYDTCPYTTSAPGNYQIEHCLGWKSPSYATSDYFNVCAGVPSGIAPPNTGMGYQFPYSGNAYCGILNEYYIQTPVPYMGFWFEYLQGNLIDALKTGYEYEFSCRIVAGDDLLEYGFWKFGMAFTSDAISRTDPKPFTNILPQVMNEPSNYLIDSINWTEITGKFVAQGGEKFITIGFFSDTMNLDTLRCTDIVVDPTHFGSYYLVDACSLKETGNQYWYPNIFSPNGDGVNDVWKPFFFQEGRAVEIFNRWGNKIYEINDIKSQWEGDTESGIECSEGVYYFMVKGRHPNDLITKGSIQLVRE